MPEREAGAPPDAEDLWTVFEAAAANVETARREQWLALAAALALDAGLFALYLALSPWSCWDAVVPAGAVLLVALAATYYVASCKVWIQGDRARMKRVLDSADEDVREAWAQKKRHRNAVPLFRAYCADSLAFVLTAAWIAAAAVLYAIAATYGAQP